jgi:ABC-type transporter Mla maintaining outer membrane lipid asymmetry permease subunit MlaE
LFEYGIELESVKIAILFGLKTFCPMMSVMLLTAKSCTASASIVKTMWINGDFKVMNILNLPYKQVYLHPIFVACAIAGPLLNLVAMAGILTGSCLSWVAKGHSVKLFFSILSVTDYIKYITNSELRAFLASLFAGICTCVAGLVPGRDFQSIILVINTCITLSFITNIFAQTIVSLF